MIWYGLALGLWNVFVFAMYALDKSRAVKQQWRIPESRLLWMTYAFGGLGAYLAARAFHHKTRKWYFKLSWFLGIVLILVTSYYVWRLTNEWKINF